MKGLNRLTVYAEDFNELKPNDYDCSNQYNVISIPYIKFYLSSLGYKKIIFSEFKIPIELEIQDKNFPSSHTRKMLNGENIIFSGPLYLPWYNFVAMR